MRCARGFLVGIYCSLLVSRLASARPASSTVAQCSLALPLLQSPEYVEFLTRNITKAGLPKGTIHFLKVCVRGILEIAYIERNEAVCRPQCSSSACVAVCNPRAHVAPDGAPKGHRPQPARVPQERALRSVAGSSRYPSGCVPQSHCSGSGSGSPTRSTDERFPTAFSSHHINL